jgi:hypothetical protein
LAPRVHADRLRDRPRTMRHFCSKRNHVLFRL